RSIVILFLITALGPSTLLAAPTAATWRARAGAEVGSQSQHGYLDLEMPLLGRFRKGLTQRLSLDWREYSYGADNSSVDMRALGAEYALGYQSGGGAGWWGGYIGLQHRQIERSPERPQDEGGDEPWRLGFHFKGELQLDPLWRASGKLDTYPASKGYELRGRLLRDIGDGLSVGPEVSYQADQDQDAKQLGIVISGFRPLPGLKTTARAGIEQNGEGERGWFIGLEFSRHF
ncbi:MAG TPA: cellulose biosynthesis protein BcsS, partial [Gammaproteobacteria bacterium]|nr:cellulose biosynthesis protein BcsS [Gammaproteobacteria bacterium]